MEQSSKLNLWHKGYPPVESCREKCKCCDRSLPVETRSSDPKPEYVHPLDMLYPPAVEHVTHWRYKGFGNFCTLFCGTAFANQHLDQIAIALGTPAPYIKKSKKLQQVA